MVASSNQFNCERSSSTYKVNKILVEIAENAPGSAFSRHVLLGKFRSLNTKY
jgi:hypothetical protein